MFGATHIPIGAGAIGAGIMTLKSDHPNDHFWNGHQRCLDCQIAWDRIKKRLCTRADRLGVVYSGLCCLKIVKASIANCLLISRFWTATVDLNRGDKQGQSSHFIHTGIFERQNQVRLERLNSLWLLGILVWYSDDWLAWWMDYESVGRKFESCRAHQ